MLEETNWRESGFFYFVFDPNVVKAPYLKTHLEKVDGVIKDKRCSHLELLDPKYHINELGFQYKTSYNSIRHLYTRTLFDVALKAQWNLMASVYIVVNLVAIL